MNTFSPGWYPDPYDSQAQRYWDGECWTEHTHPLAGTAQAPEPQGQTATQAPFPSEPQPPKKSRAWLWWVIGVAGVLLVAAAVACVWWALAVVGQASAEDRDPCDSSLAQCDGPGRDEPEPEPETRPTPTTTPREQEATEELQRFCEAGAVEAYLDLQSAAIAAISGAGTVDDVRVQLDLFEQELAQMPEEASSSAGYAANEAEIRQFLSDSRASVDAGDARGVAGLIVDGPDVVGAFSETCSGHGFLGW